jgi:hypothetical protein
MELFNEAQICQKRMVSVKSIKFCRNNKWEMVTKWNMKIREIWKT